MQEIIDRAGTLLSQSDSAAVVEYLNRQPDPTDVTEVYGTLVKGLYYEQKDLPLVIALARAGIQYSLAAADEAEQSDRAAHLRGRAKAMAYNLASYTWPGWDEPGIVVDATAVVIGLDAAKTNLRLARELKKGDLPLSRAHWMMGAQFLAAGQVDAARESFQKAANHAGRAGEQADQLLAEGFAAIVDLLQSPADSALQERLETVKAEMAFLEHGTFFIEQLDTALRVFEPRNVD